MNENFRDAHALLATSLHAAITRVQKVRDYLIKRTRMRTVVPRALEQFPRTVCTALPCALNCARRSRNNLVTLCTPSPRNYLLSTSACDLTPTVLPEWQHLHCNAIAQDCGFAMRSRSDVRSYAPPNFAQLYIKFSPQHSHIISFSNAKFNFNCLVARRLFRFEMNADA